MSSTQGPRSAASLGYVDDELQGQYRIPDGQQCMRFTQIASDGGLLPFPLVRNTFELWPAKRREVVVDFTRYLDGSPTTKGDVVYLTNVMKMTDGRMWDNSSRSSPDAAYKVPILKFVIDDLAPDDSQVPPVLRPLPPLPPRWKDLHAEPADLRGQARRAGRRDRVADQRRAVRAGQRRAEPEEPRRPAGRSPSSAWAASTSGRSATGAAVGCTRSTCTWRSTAR